MTTHTTHHIYSLLQVQCNANVALLRKKIDDGCMKIIQSSPSRTHTTLERIDTAKEQSLGPSFQSSILSRAENSVVIRAIERASSVRFALFEL